MPSLRLKDEKELRDPETVNRAVNIIVNELQNEFDNKLVSQLGSIESLEDEINTENSAILNENKLKLEFNDTNKRLVIRIGSDAYYADLTKVT